MDERYLIAICVANKSDCIIRRGGCPVIRDRAKLHGTLSLCYASLL